MELLATFTYLNLKVETFYMGGDFLKYKVYLDHEEVLTEKMKPSPIYCVDDDNVILSIVESILDNNTLEFHSFEVNELKQMLNDFWSRDDEDFLTENNLTQTFCNRITKNITKN